MEKIWNFDLEFGTPDDSMEDSAANTFRNASAAGNAVQAGIQTESLQAAIDGYARWLNQSAVASSTGAPVQTPTAQFKGFAAEEYFKHTLKMNALAEGIPDYKLGVYTKGEMPDGTTLSGIDMETDIAVFTRKCPWNKPRKAVEYQAKIHNKAEAYKKDINNPQYQNVKFVGGAGQGVNDKVTVEAGGKTVSSDSITPKEAENLAQAMKEQNTPQYSNGAEKHKQLNKVNLKRAVKTGALTGAVLSTVKEICDVIKNGDDLPEDQFIKSINNILCGTADGAVRGGAIMGSVQIAGSILGKEIAANSLGAVPVMAAANTAVDFAKDLYKCFVTKEIDADDLLCNTVNNTFSSAAGFGGAWVGGQMAGQAVNGLASAKIAAETGAAIGSALGPIGTVVGSLVGGIVIGFGAQAVINTAQKDALKAFNDSIEEINSHIELDGCAKLYYFADAMSELSDYRLSFKNLIPCYSLISDLKEYSLRKKAMKNMKKQLETNLSNLDASRLEALKNIGKQHENRIRQLRVSFEEQKGMMQRNFKSSMDSYMAAAYSQYVGLADVLSGDISSMKESYTGRLIHNNSVLECARTRNKTNKYLNEMLAELMREPEGEILLKPFIDTLLRFMEQDEMLTGKQYLSWEDAAFLVNGGV